MDLNPMLDLGLVNSAIEQLEECGCLMRGPVSTLEEIEDLYGIAYIAPMDMSATPFSAGSFDACISSNTLEHIPRDTIAAIWQETRRLLAPSGFVSASIDYSDHYAHTDRTIPMLHFLRYTRKEWQRYNHPNHFQNRLRHRHHIDLLTDAGFRIEKEMCASPEKLDGISIPPENMTGSETDLARWGRILALP
ncbi:class I SAM-dependent methyltransferase [uncultured Nitratireductor sp.]|uniref:class I SAM-dependent methyltransferase n=1 Tax=uncultured Nitratireductor sp. TaxID=520953 RepID=UPI0025FBF618|nr:class I SAM-dependent methyltransferase [uncultured Nitratireductor sp.]